MPRDDLGESVTLTGPARRVVSLVPSLTEAIATDQREALVGATAWCTHPAGLDVARVRGPKNPDVEQIVALRPDLVVANQEENRALDVRRLRERGVPVWVTSIETVDEAFASMRRLYREALRWGVPEWLEQAERIWQPREHERVRALVPIWRDPWMAVGHPTFTADLLARVGVEVVSPPGRYPRVDLQDALATLQPELVLLPDEPYRFHAEDGPEAFSGIDYALVEGRAITWYGPSLVTARQTILDALGRR